LLTGTTRRVTVTDAQGAITSAAPIEICGQSATGCCRRSRRGNKVFLSGVPVRYGARDGSEDARCASGKISRALCVSAQYQKKAPASPVDQGRTWS